MKNTTALGHLRIWCNFKPNPFYNTFSQWICKSAQHPMHCWLHWCRKIINYKTSKTIDLGVFFLQLLPKIYCNLQDSILKIVRMSFEVFIHHICILHIAKGPKMAYEAFLQSTDFHLSSSKSIYSSLSKKKKMALLFFWQKPWKFRQINF